MRWLTHIFSTRQPAKEIRLWLYESEWLLHCDLTFVPNSKAIYVKSDTVLGRVKKARMDDRHKPLRSNRCNHSWRLFARIHSIPTRACWSMSAYWSNSSQSRQPCPWNPVHYTAPLEWDQVAQAGHNRAQIAWPNFSHHLLKMLNADNSGCLAENGAWYLACHKRYVLMPTKILNCAVLLLPGASGRLSGTSVARANNELCSFIAWTLCRRVYKGMLSLCALPKRICWDYSYQPILQSHGCKCGKCIMSRLRLLILASLPKSEIIGTQKKSTWIWLCILNSISSHFQQ